MFKYLFCTKSLKSNRLIFTPKFSGIVEFYILKYLKNGSNRTPKLTIFDEFTRKISIFSTKNSQFWHKNLNWIFKGFSSNRIFCTKMDFWPRVGCQERIWMEMHKCHFWLNIQRPPKKWNSFHSQDLKELLSQALKSSLFALLCNWYGSHFKVEEGVRFPVKNISSCNERS